MPRLRLRCPGGVPAPVLTFALPRPADQYLLEVRWRGDVAEEAFTIKCRTEELLKQWQKMIMRAVVEAPNTRRRTHHLSNTTRRSERGVNSPLSQFPGTPLSEAGPSSAASVYSYQSEYAAGSPYPVHANTAQPSYPPNSNGNGNGFDDEGDDAYDQPGPESGRSTPSSMGTARRGPTTRSLPPGEREDPRSASRPRAHTEESSSAVINQWRNQTPPDAYPVPVPSIPRGASHASNGSASDSHSLRSSASSRQLRGKQSQEWGSPAQGHAPTSSVGSIGQGQAWATSPAQGHARLPPPHDDDATPRPGGLGRLASHAPPGGPPQPPPPMRNRSQSSPNMSQPQPSPNPSGSGSRGADEWGNVPPLSMTHKSGGTNSAGTLASASSASTNTKHFSSSSNGTDRSSGTSSQSAGQTHTAATSPATTLPPSAGLASGGAQVHHLSRGHDQGEGATAVAVRVKVTYGDDTFVVVVLSTVSYRELLDKVLKKIRLCGDRSQVDVASLRLRYQDEDGDKILITSEEDVTMAFEAVRSMAVGGAASGPQTLVLFATVDAQNS